MARTNIQNPDDPRPLPRGIRPIAPRRFRRRPAPTHRAPRTAQQLHVAHQADRRVATRLSHIRDNLQDYELNYPAAVQVRDRLGLLKWEKLERYRLRIVTFSQYMRKLDREQLAVPAEQLDVFVPAMKQYIKRVCEERQLDMFECMHESLDAVIEDDTYAGHGIQNGGPMGALQDMFHERPTLWFVYNLYFPLVNPTVGPGVSRKGRMNWGQQMHWAIWTLEHPCPRHPQVEEPSANGIVWNRALVEVFNKIRRAFPAQN